MKTLAIRLDDDLHAQISALAKLTDTNVTDFIRTAVEERAKALSKDPGLAEKAKAALADIDAEAASRRSAIANLFDAEEEPKPKAGGRRRTNGAGDSA
jgi:predicted transcriptional regulator